MSDIAIKVPPTITVNPSRNVTIAYTTSSKHSVVNHNPVSIWPWATATAPLTIREGVPSNSHTCIASWVSTIHSHSASVVLISTVNTVITQA